MYDNWRKGKEGKGREEGKERWWPRKNSLDFEYIQKVEGSVEGSRYLYINNAGLCRSGGPCFAAYFQLFGHS